MLPNLQMYAIVGGLAALMIGGVIAYYYWSQDKIDGLQTQVTLVKQQSFDLKAEVDKQQRDMLLIKQAQDSLTQSLNDTRKAADQATLLIKQQHIGATAKIDPRKTETQINLSTQQAFDQLEEVSHAKH